MRVYRIDIPTSHGSEDALRSRGMGEFVPQIRERIYPVHRRKRPFDPVGSRSAR